MNEMTDKIAFALGEFNFPSFYSSVMWYGELDDFPLHPYFDLNTNDAHDPRYGEKSFTGRLKTEMIQDTSHKLAYIRGRLRSYSVFIERDKIKVSYANSKDLMDFFTECLYEVIMSKFFNRSNTIESMFSFSLEKRETFMTAPKCFTVVLTASPDIIRYITVYE